MTEMQASVENVGRLNRRLNVIVPNTQLEQRKKTRLAELAKTIRVDGFRAGKVPVSFIEKRYGENIRGEVIQESLQASLSEALQKNSLNPAGQPHIDSIKAEPGQDLEYSATFEVYPEVIAPELKGVSLEKLRVDISEADIAEVLKKMCRQHADWIEVERKAQIGDKVTFDLNFAEGQPRKDLELVLEEEKIPEGFASLLGSETGDALTVSLPNSKESGQTYSATIQVQKIAEPKLAEPNDAFAKRLGIQEGGIEALREQLRQHMQGELDRVLNEKLKAQVITQLIAMPFPTEELPQVLRDEELKRLEADAQEKQKQQGNIEPLTAKQREDLQLKADERVKLGLFFSALIEKYHIHVDEIRVQQAVERLASALQLEQAMKEKFFSDKNMMTNIRSSVLEEQVIDKLLGEADYTEKTANYRDIMNLSEKKDHESKETTA